MTTMTNARTLKIDGMSGDTCIQKVKTALKGVAGVTTDSVKVGSATIHTEKSGQCEAACTAVTNAGYKAREAANSANQNQSGPAGEHGRNADGTHPSKGSQNMASEGAGGAIGGAAQTAKAQHKASPEAEKHAGTAHR